MHRVCEKGGWMMKYTIGEFASLIGVTPDTLRLYEKKGIIVPYKDEENAYRYYSDLDVRQVLMSRWYRSLMIPLEQVSAMTNDYSYEEIEETLVNQRGIIQEKIETLQSISDCIDNTLEAIQGVGTLHKMILPEWYRISQTQENILHSSGKKTSTAKGLMDLLPISFYTCVIHLDSFNTQWGLAVEAKELSERVRSRYKIDIKELEYYPRTPVIRTTIRLKGQEELNHNSISHVLETVKERGYRLDDKPVLAKLLFTDGLSKNCNHKTAYIQLLIPIINERS